MICPVCDGDLIAKSSLPLERTKIRVYQCNTCRRRVTTYENYTYGTTEEIEGIAKMLADRYKLVEDNKKRA